MQREELPQLTEVVQPEIICVLGMHRSGTSLLTRVLNLMGVYLGPDRLLMPPTAFNPTGHWEHDGIVPINVEILKRHKGSWDAPPKLPPNWENAPEMDDLKQRARDLIRDSFGTTKIWGWKDPRSCLTLPFWQQLIPDMRYIVCLRNPVDVAYSLAQRDKFSAEKSSYLWLTYVNSALANSEGKPQLVIFYEDLMDDCLNEVRRLAHFLGKPERAEQVDVQEAVQEFIENGLQHHRTSVTEVVAHPEIAFRARALYMAQRISVSLGRKDALRAQKSDQQIEKALDILSKYSVIEPGHVNPLIRQLAELEDQLAGSGNTIRVLETRIEQQDKNVETISVLLAEREQALKMLSTDLAAKEGAVQTLTSQAIEQDASVQTLSAELTAREGTVQTLTSQLIEKEETVRTLSTELAARDETVQTLASQVVERDMIVQSLSTELAARDKTIGALSTELAALNRIRQSEAETTEERISVLTAQLLDTETRLKQITDTLGWRLLSLYGPIKYRFLLPIYRLLGQMGEKRTEPEPLENKAEGKLAVRD